MLWSSMDAAPEPAPQSAEAAAATKRTNKLISTGAIRAYVEKLRPLEFRCGGEGT